MYIFERPDIVTHITTLLRTVSMVGLCLYMTDTYTERLAGERRMISACVCLLDMSLLHQLSVYCSGVYYRE